MYVHSLTKLLCLTLYLHLVNDCVKDFNSAIVDSWMSSKQIMQAIRQKSYDDAVSVPIKGSAKIRRISCMTCILAAEILWYNTYTVLYVGTCMQLLPIIRSNWQVYRWSIAMQTGAVYKASANSVHSLVLDQASIHMHTQVYWASIQASTIAGNALWMRLRLGQWYTIEL